MSVLRHVGVRCLLALLGVFSASCLAEPTPDATQEPTQEAQDALPIVNFEAKEFSFVTIIPYRGKKAGGWQQAKPVLPFTNWIIPHWPRTWSCTLTIGMPLETEIMGTISASRAAEISSGVTTLVAREMDYELPPGIFCSKFRGLVEERFKRIFPLLGATIAP